MHNKRNQTHGLRYTPEYKTWSSMKERCLNSQHPSYKNYGGRGIKICDRWLNNAEAFYKDMGKRPEGMSLDRIDNEGNYEPSNCRWATQKEQRNNTRQNRYITWDNKTRTISQWSDETGISQAAITIRLNRLSWSIGKALGKTL